MAWFTFHLWLTTVEQNRTEIFILENKLLSAKYYSDKCLLFLF